MRLFPRSLRATILAALDVVVEMEGEQLRQDVIARRQWALPRGLKWLGNVSEPIFYAEMVRLEKRELVTSQRLNGRLVIRSERIYYRLVRAEYLPPTDTRRLIPRQMSGPIVAVLALAMAWGLAP